jgi:hypothetical protein
MVALPLRWVIAGLFCLSGNLAMAADAKPYCYRAGRLGLPAPLPAKIVESESAFSIEFGTGTRNPSTMTVAAGPAQGPGAAERTLGLKDGLMLHYATEVQEAIGSGGAEAVLTGTITGDGELLGQIRCSVQSETAVDPAWCLRYAQDLVLADDRCNNDAAE